MRCLLLVSALCLAGCKGNKSECPCTLSVLGYRQVVWKGEVKPSPDLCPGSSFRALLNAAKGAPQSRAWGWGEELGCKSWPNRQKPQALCPSHVRHINRGEG